MEFYISLIESIQDKFLFGTLGLCPVYGDLYPAGQHGGVFVLHFPVGAKCCRIYETEHSRDFACMGSLSGQVGNAAFDLANDLCGWSGKMGRREGLWYTGWEGGRRKGKWRQSFYERKCCEIFWLVRAYPAGNFGRTGSTHGGI